MTNKTFNGRIVNKHDTAENWAKATSFIPKQGEIIVYDADANYDYERFKIGDGETVVSSLPFANDEKADIQHSHDASDITSGTLPLTMGGTGADLSDVPTGAIITKSSTDKLTYWNAVPIEHGGTGSTTVEKARQNLNYIGLNPITTPEEDIPENWINLGTGVAFINGDGQLNNQPVAWGYLENYTSGSYIFQTLHSLNGNSTVWKRSGTKDKWYSGSENWVKEFDEKGGTIKGDLTVEGKALFTGAYGTGSDGYVNTLNEVGGGKINTGSGTTGILKVIFPQDFNRSMIKFDVEISSYSRQTIATYSFCGQIYKNSDNGSYSWSYRSYDVQGSSLQTSDNNFVKLPIAFGRHNEKAAVSIGRDTTAWGYSAISIRNVKIWNANFTTANWANGWSLVVDANPLDEILNEYPFPLAATRQSASYINQNPIENVEEDTPENWIKLGTGHAYITGDGKLNGQPATHGILENLVIGTAYVFQTFTSYTTGTSGRKFVRIGNTTNGWSTQANWVESVDSISNQTITGMKTFENGITIGTAQENAQIVYDVTEGALRISFLEVTS